MSAPALDVKVRLGALMTAPASLDVTAEVGDQKYSKRFDVSTALADNETSLRIQLGMHGDDPVDILLTVRAFSEPDGRGEMLSETSHQVAASPNGCNAVTIDLWPHRMVCDASCTASCRNADICLLQCGTGSRCYADCVGAAECDVTCDPGSSCSIDCTGSGDCTNIRCGAGAACALFCGTAEDCSFRECTGMQQTCPDGTIVCNAYCN